MKHRFRFLFCLFVQSICCSIILSGQNLGRPEIYIHQNVVNDSIARISVTTTLYNQMGKNRSLEIRCGIWDNREFITRAIQKVELESSGKVSVTEDLEFGMPVLWNGTLRPYLYKLKVEVLESGKILESVTQPLGLRKFGFDKDDKFILNNKEFPLYGVYPDWNENSASSGSYQRLKKLLQNICFSGANCVCLPPPLQTDAAYSLCDSLGLIVWSDPVQAAWWIPYDSIDRNRDEDHFHWYKTRWTQKPIMYIAGKKDTMTGELPVKIVVYCNVMNPDLEVNGNRVNIREDGATYIEYVWKNVILREGMNTIRATASKKGIRTQRYLDCLPEMIYNHW